MNEFKIKAIKLREKHYEVTCCNEEAKRCAIVTVNEVIKQLEQLSIQESGTNFIDFGQVYWNDVKNELEKM